LLFAKFANFPFYIRPRKNAIHAIANAQMGVHQVLTNQNNFNDPDYTAAFRVLLRELMVSNPAFFEKMKEIL
jgi:hypothetical protein